MRSDRIQLGMCVMAPVPGGEQKATVCSRDELEPEKRVWIRLWSGLLMCQKIDRLRVAEEGFVRYGKYNFRTRLAARWAVFFDNIGIYWTYLEAPQPHANGRGYWVDFWLPTFGGGMWIKIITEDPAREHSPEELAEGEQFVFATKHDLWWAYRMPELREYWVSCYCNGAVFGGDPEGVEDPIDAIPLIDQAQGENRMFWTPGFEPDPDDFPEYMAAVEAARDMIFD